MGTTPDGEAMLNWSATRLSRAIRTREVAPSEVMAAWQAQVHAVNGVVNALVSLRAPDQMMAEARVLDDVPLGELAPRNSFCRQGSGDDQRLSSDLGPDAAGCRGRHLPFRAGRTWPGRPANWDADYWPVRERCGRSGHRTGLPPRDGMAAAPPASGGGRGFALGLRKKGAECGFW